MRKSIIVILAAIAATALFGLRAFDWRGATVYFVITDRFCNGDSTNDLNYGRCNDYGSERLNAATFHGGDFKGMLSKAREGYFDSLGLDVMWITDAYEQIHGWMSGSGAVNDFPHYGYHGYYPLDYTQTDKNYGTVEEMRALVDELHSRDIRVMLGANINNPGYPTLLDALQLGFAPVDMTEAEAVRHIRTWSYDDFFGNCADWTDWYGGDWIRFPREYSDNSPLTATLFGLPDFKDESHNTVSIPSFLHNKWAKEGTENDPWVCPAAKALRIDRAWTPLQYIVAWIAAWVEEFGIDGMRCDIVENSHLESWKVLNRACNEALTRWRAKHAGQPAADWTDPFYMTGDYDGSWIDRKPEYASAGFGSMVNFYFPKHGDFDGIVATWQQMADSLAAHSDWAPFSYLNNSYHRDADSTGMAACLTTLLLAPGTVQLFYGDESGRKESLARLNVDSNQAFRSDMNWTSVDSTLLAHTRALGRIRRDNPVIATGRQRTVDVHTALRYNDTDSVLIILHPAEGNGPAPALPPHRRKIYDSPTVSILKL